MSSARVAVVGGGITGLAAAHALLDAPDAEVVVFEQSGRAGGKILTSAMAGVEVDEGPDAFLARVPWATDLCRSLGLADRLVTPGGRGAYLWSRGALRRLPGELVLGVPSDIVGVARSGVLSWSGVARAALEPVTGLGGRRHRRDCVGEVVRRRYGAEVATRLVDPLLGAIYAGDIDHMSVAATAPQLAAADRAVSMTLALRRQRSKPTSDTPAPVFYSLRGGLQVLVDALVEELGDRIRLSHPVHAIEPGGLVDGEKFDAVIVAAPAPVAARLLAGGAPTTSALLKAIEYASVALVTLAVPDTGFGRPLDASGLLVPRPDRRHVTACSWFSSKWPSCKPDGQAILRASVGSIDSPADSELDDDTMVTAVLSELGQMMALRAEPTEVRVSRWPRSFPQYQPGHLERVDAIEQSLGTEIPEAVVAGAAMRGIGIPACIRQGTDAAARVRALL